MKEDGKIKMDSTSDLLERVVEENTGDTISIGEIKNSLHERGFGVLMALAALPLCLPVPVPPGYTTFFAIPLFILSVQMIYGKDSPWIPNWLAKKRISRKKLAGLIVKAVPLLRKMERLVKPRLCYNNLEIWEKSIGIFSFIFAISIAVPLPLTNLPPGYGILLMSLGLLGKDGFTIIIGMVIGVIGCFITAFILIESADLIRGWFSSPEELEETTRLIVDYIIYAT